MWSKSWRHTILRWGTFGLLALSALEGRAAAQGSGHPDARRHTPHLHAFNVREGVLTLDGLTIKTHVNLRTAGLAYLVIELPALGTVRVAEAPFAGAEEQKAAFHGNALLIHAAGRRLELTAANRLRRTRSAYVRFEPGLARGGTSPAIGYADATLQHVVWSGEEANAPTPSRHLRVSGRRSPRTARLCQPSRSGSERCAIVHEVLYRP